MRSEQSRGQGARKVSKVVLRPALAGAAAACQIGR
jgi:hypothetical protein